MLSIKCIKFNECWLSLDVRLFMETLLSLCTSSPRGPYKHRWNGFKIAGTTRLIFHGKSLYLRQMCRTCSVEQAYSCSLHRTSQADTLSSIHRWQRSHPWAPTCRCCSACSSQICCNLKEESRTQRTQTSPTGAFQVPLPNTWWDNLIWRELLKKRPSNISVSLCSIFTWAFLTPHITCPQWSCFSQ